MTPRPDAPRPFERELLFEHVDREREIQDCKYGHAQKSRAEWVMVIAKWAGKLADAGANGNHEEFRRRLTQVAAVCIQACEKGWFDAEEAEPEHVSSDIVAELVELAAALDGDPGRRQMLEAWGVDVGALLGEDGPKSVGLTVLAGGKV